MLMPLRPSARGASVWVLSRRRATVKLVLVEQKEKHSDLLGGWRDYANYG